MARRPRVKLAQGETNEYSIMAACRRSARIEGWTNMQIIAFCEKAEADDGVNMLKVVSEFFEVM